ncbi:AraC family transcriptional regulator [Stutzerimonas stutzeri]|uniref:AraC family transcriptional regulator n=1 Tax=Stutzerimonas stutzeri TaxID=316 RepID=UPI001C2EBE84|nr:AraC family transcriptional regulator [Stutzerimonas stutzeri]
MTDRCYTVFCESLFVRNAELFAPYLAAVGLDEEFLKSPDAEIPLSQYMALWELVGREVSPCIGMQIGSRAQSSDWGAYGHAVRSAPSMQLALRCVSHFYAVIAQGMRIEVGVDEKSVTLIYQVVDPLVTERRQDAEYAISATLTILRELTKCSSLKPLRVEFEHNKLSDDSVYQGVFGCPLFFNRPDNRIEFALGLLEMPILTADTRLYQALEPFLQRQHSARSESELLSRMGAHIASGLGSGGVSIELVASGMNMGVRTLQRRLSEQGLDFTQVVEDVRRSLAEEYIARSDYSFTNIALLLGYSEASSFSRAFRRWTQLTPLEYRRRARS